MKIGLALGGGGARGIAHLGVWQRLDELGVPILVMGGKDLVCGRNGVCPRGKEIGIHSLRGGTVVYDGTWNVAETSNWYLREMPKTGWQHRATEFATDYDVVHDFVKGDEIIKMRIWRPGSTLRVEMNIDKLAAYEPQKPAAQ